MKSIVLAELIYPPHALIAQRPKNKLFTTPDGREISTSSGGWDGLGEYGDGGDAGNGGSLGFWYRSNDKFGVHSSKEMSFAR